EAPVDESGEVGDLRPRDDLSPLGVPELELVSGPRASVAGLPHAAGAVEGDTLRIAHVPPRALPPDRETVGRDELDHEATARERVEDAIGRRTDGRTREGQPELHAIAETSEPAHVD